jgi:hypothetical protein
MRTRRALIIGGGIAVLTLAPAVAASAAPAPGGCQAFGNGVATLANSLPSGQFGAITSGNASTNGREGVPTVVFTEQQTACNTPG